LIHFYKRSKMFTESPITSVTKKKKRKSQNLTFNEQDLTENDTPKKSKQPEKFKDKSKIDKIPIIKTPKTKKLEEKATKSVEKKKNIEKSSEKKKKTVEKSTEKKKILQKSPEKKKNVEKSSEKKKKKMQVENIKVKEENGVDYMKMLTGDTDGLEEFTDGRDEYEGEMEEDGGQEVQDAAFIEAMSSLHGKKKKITTNRGTNLPLSDDTVPQTDRVNLSELLNTLDGDTRKLSKRTEGGKTVPLSTPLERPAAERVTREAGYSRVREDVNIWDAVVHNRRAAENVTFPLENPDLKLQSADQVVKSRFNPSTPLEQQVAALLAGSKAVVQPGEELSQIEKKGLEGLTPREIEERKAELAKFRALQTYQEAKFRRQSKIKSKKYRKIARKEKKREKLKELEKLAETDPQAAAEELERLDRMRIEERASLKHRNASKFLQEQQKLSKNRKDKGNNKGIQETVQEQIRKHREIVAKNKLVSDSEGEEESDEGIDIDLDALEFPDKKDESFAEFNANYKKFYTEQQAKKQKMMSGAEEISEMFEDAEYSARLKVASKLRTLNQGEDNQGEEEEEVEGPEETGLEHAESLAKDPKPGKQQATDNSKKAPEKKNLDPDNFMTVETKELRSELPEIYGYNEDDDISEDEADQRRVIAEAFAEDDVAADFRAEKAKLIEATKPKDVDLTLPGWGEWGGGGLKPSKKKRKRFTIKAPPAEKRRDENKGNLIINVDKDDKIRAHKVGKVPFPFQSVSDFEASIRAPIGDTFLPRTAFLKMVRPKVETKVGEVIEPMDRTHLLRKNIDVHT